MLLRPLFADKYNVKVRDSEPIRLLESPRFLSVYVLWFNFVLGSDFISHCFKLIIIHKHTNEKKGNKI